MKKTTILTLIFLFIFFCTANAEIYTAVKAAENYFRNINGIVIDEKGLIDLGEKNNVVPGLKLTVYSEGEEIVHPVTGKILGHKKGDAGELVVTKVFPEYSEVQFTDKPKVKDAVAFKTPVGVNVVTSFGTDDDKKVIESVLSANPVMRAGNDYTINISKISGKILVNIIQADNKTIFTEELNVEGVKKMDLMANIALPEHRFYSIALGNIYKNNEKKYLVASTEKKLFILDPENSYKIKEEVKENFSTITNIELADLDNDGQMEIFVSNVKEGRWVQSMILKHNGSKFAVVESKIPYLFRTRLTDGVKREMLVQQVANQGGYKGEILKYKYDTVKNKYVAAEPLKGTLGKYLFGFTYTDGKEPLYFNIGKSNNLEVSTFRKTEFVSSSYYGDSLNSITGVTMAKADEESSEIRNEKVIFVSPRVELIENKFLVLAENALASRMLSRSRIFSSSALHIETFDAGILKKQYITDELKPIISDIFVYKDGDSYIIMAVRCTNEWLIQSAESSLLMFKLDLK